MTVKSPGFDNSVGNRNRRLNRYGAQSIGAGNRSDVRHKEVRGITLGYDTVPVPDEITDSGNDLAKFEVNEEVESFGSTSNDGIDVVQTVVAGALGVDDAVTLEVAGASIVLASRNNRIDSRLT